MNKMPISRFKEITEMYGFKYGPTFSVIKEVWERNNEGLCLVDISESLNMEANTGNYFFHPSILDACLQSCFVPLGSSLTDEKSVVPVGFKTVSLYDVPLTKRLYCHVVKDVTEFGSFNVTVMSPTGSVLLKMNDVRVTELTDSPQERSFDELKFEVQWIEDELKGQSESTSHLTCLVLKNTSSFSESLVARLQALEVTLITVDPPNSSCYNGEAEEAIQTALENIPPHNLPNLRIINLWPLEASFLPNSFEVIEQAQRLAFSSSTFLMRMLLDKDLINCQLFLVTERTQLLHDCSKSLERVSIPWRATVWGLRRTAIVEELNMRVTAVDLCNKEDKQEVESLVKEILGDSVEDEVVFQGRKRFINRLLRPEVHQAKSTITSTKDHKRKRSLYLSTILNLSSQFEGDVVFSASKTVEYVRNDISDILLSPLAFEKLTMQGLEILESKGVLTQLLGIKMESLNLEASIKATNGSIDKEACRKPEVKESTDISFSVLSLSTMEEESHRGIPLFPQGLDECGLKDNRTYLVAGGLRGFGFEVACWMAENGAKTIAVLSRSKPSDTKRRELQHIERTTGAKIYAFQVG